MLGSESIVSSGSSSSSVSVLSQKVPNGTPLIIARPNEDNVKANKDNKDNHEESSSSSSSYLSVASFNLLAPIYVRPIDKRTGTMQSFAAFEWIKPGNDSTKILDIENRGPRLLQSLQTCQADVICLQELQMEVAAVQIKVESDETTDSSAGNTNSDKASASYILPYWLQPITESYQVHLPPPKEIDKISERNLRVLGSKVAVTCAILVKKGIKCETMPVGDDNTCVSVCINNNNNQKVVATSIHLDAKDEVKRVNKLSKCLQRARDFTPTKSESISTIIAGDFNTELLSGSCCNAFLEVAKEGVVSSTPAADDMERECAGALRLLPKNQKPSEQQMKEWHKLYEETQNKVNFDFCVSLDRIGTGTTRSAYDHNNNDVEDTDTDTDTDTKATDRQIMAQWKLDHIVYATDTLRPIKYWSTLEDDFESCQIGLPNLRIGSDHLPVGALFQIRNDIPRQLPQEEQIRLSNHLESLLETQKLEFTAKSNELDEELHVLEARIGESNEGNEDQSEDGKSKPKKLKKKKKKGPPPQPIIDFMRSKRTTIRVMKEKHKQQRSGLVSGLNNLQRLFIQQKYNCTSISQWIERG